MQHGRHQKTHLATQGLAVAHSTLSKKESRTQGALTLSFFTLFWLFVLCSVVGLVGETVVSFFRDGRWESRAGLLFGPFSPIYGVGGVLMTVALNRLYDKGPLVQFTAAGLVGASFEYLAGWFWESAFGIVAWSYEEQPFNFGGHTSLFMMCVWGAIGLAWVRLALPAAMRLTELFPKTIRKPLTAVCASLLLADILLTIGCLDCWYLRMAGLEPENAWQQFCATYFNDSFMQTRFETMSIWPVLANR